VDPTARRFLTIEATPRGIAEIEAGARAVFIPREKIRAIRVMYGATAERPVRMLVVGLPFLGFGLLTLLAALYVLFIDHHPRYIGRLLMTGPFFGALGLWLCWRAIRTGPYLLVDADGDQRKLLLPRDFSRERLNEFLLQVKQELRLNVDLQIPEKAGLPGA
jgi:hypothetical protein